MKTSPWKIVDLARQCAMIICTFRARDFNFAFLKIVNYDKIKFTSFGGKIIHQKRFEASVRLDLPIWGHLNTDLCLLILSILSAKEVICPF